jgi:hypothetical protein
MKGGLCHGIRAKVSFELCVKEKFSTMPPRRCVERPVENPTLEREMREPHARLDAMEIK